MRRTALAFECFLTNVLYYQNVVAIRTSIGLAKLPRLERDQRSVLLWWNRDIANISTYEADVGGPLVTKDKDIVGELWPTYRYIHLATDAPAPYGMQDVLAPALAAARAPIVMMLIPNWPKKHYRS